ncbi:unnamed protein product [Amoebophrya sp. A25]|nr:unnamed protein product [Amoebophrya sp. A25]|eukprot:GSA25T00001725001.1
MDDMTKKMSDTAASPSTIGDELQDSSPSATGTTATKTGSPVKNSYNDKEPPHFVRLRVLRKWLDENGCALPSYMELASDVLKGMHVRVKADLGPEDLEGTAEGQEDFGTFLARIPEGAVLSDADLPAEVCKRPPVTADFPAECWTATQDIWVFLCLAKTGKLQTRYQGYIESLPPIRRVEKSTKDDEREVEPAGKKPKLVNSTTTSPSTSSVHATEHFGAGDDELFCPDDPTHWDAKTLVEFLGSSNLYHETVRVKAMLKLQVDRWAGPTYGISLNEWLWARSVYTSRVFGAGLKRGATVPVMLPLIDVFNHDRACPVEVVRSFDSGRAEPDVVLAGKKVDDESDDMTEGAAAAGGEQNLHLELSPGAEVFNNYGRKGNEELLLGYGFSLPDNPHNSVQLRATLRLTDVEGKVLSRDEYDDFIAKVKSWLAAGRAAAPPAHEKAGKCPEVVSAEYPNLTVGPFFVSKFDKEAASEARRSKFRDKIDGDVLHAIVRSWRSGTTAEESTGAAAVKDTGTNRIEGIALTLSGLKDSGALLPISLLTFFTVVTLHRETKLLRSCYLAEKEHDDDDEEPIDVACANALEDLSGCFKAKGATLEPVVARINSAVQQHAGEAQDDNVQMKTGADRVSSIQKQRRQQNCRNYLTAQAELFRVATGCCETISEIWLDECPSSSRCLEGLLTNDTSDKIP